MPRSAAASRRRLRDGAIVTDVGSVKGAAIEALQPVLPGRVHFVPGHPVAGTEHSGPEAGFAELFHDRWCILTPLPDTAPEAVAKVTRAVGSGPACGSRRWRPSTTTRCWR